MLPPKLFVNVSRKGTSIQIRTGDGHITESHSVEAHLLYEILQELKLQGLKK